MTSTWFSRSQPSTSVSDRPRRSSAATFAQSPGWRAAFSRFSPGRFQEAPMPTSSKTCRNRPTPGAGSLPQPAQHLGQRPAQAVQRRHLHAVARLEGGLQPIQPRPVPGGPDANVLEDLSQSANTRRWFSRLLASASLAPGSGVTA